MGKRTAQLGWAAIALLVFVLGYNLQPLLVRLSFYKSLYDYYPFYVPETLKSALQILLCVAALTLTYRLTLRGVIHELALDAPLLGAFLFSLAASSPMLIGFLLTRHVGSNRTALELVYLEAVAPFAEEVLFRGYCFRQLYRRARWPFWAAVIVTAVVFGLGHIEKGATAADMVGLFLITGVGGAFFSWLLARWKNLWVPFAMHLFMNLWWDAFSVGNTALGGWFAFTLQISTMLCAIALTLYVKRVKHPGIIAAAMSASD